MSNRRMKLNLRICSFGALCGAIALFALDSDQAVSPTIDIEAVKSATSVLSLESESAVDSAQLIISYEDIRTVGKGDTLMALLTDAGVTAPTADRAIRAMAKIYKPRRIKPGQQIVLTLQPQSSPKAPPSLGSLTFTFLFP